MAIKRIWHGWTTPENAKAYSLIFDQEVRPGIEAKNIQGFQGLQLLSRDLGNEVEFMTIMSFESLENIIPFQGNDYERAYIPDVARAVLSRWDDVCEHYEFVESRM